MFIRTRVVNLKVFLSCPLQPQSCSVVCIVASRLTFASYGTVGSVEEWADVFSLRENNAAR